MSGVEKTIWVKCGSCGNEDRMHRILHEKFVSLMDGPDGPEEGRDYHRFVECMGCKNTKYVTSTINYFDEDSEEKDFKIYGDKQDTRFLRMPIIDNDDPMMYGGPRLIPEKVWKMYAETIAAYNSKILTLAGGGLRAVVEAICLDKGITNGNLAQKIGQLEDQKLLTAAQAELLHEERYLGNAALHELETPSARDIEDGLGIVEGLLNTIYILPSKAKRLKDKRVAKASPAKP